MSNSNRYWGKKYGSISLRSMDPKRPERGPWGPIFSPRQMTSGPSNSGPHQVGLIPNSPAAKRAAADKARFLLLRDLVGLPVITHRWPKLAR